MVVRCPSRRPQIILMVSDSRRPSPASSPRGSPSAIHGVRRAVGAHRYPDHARNCRRRPRPVPAACRTVFGGASDQLGLPRLPLGAHSRGPSPPPTTSTTTTTTTSPRPTSRRNGTGSVPRAALRQRPRRSTSPRLHGSLYSSSPGTVAHRIATTTRTLGLDQLDFKKADGTMPARAALTSIEPCGTQLITSCGRCSHGDSSRCSRSLPFRQRVRHQIL